jgi:hypothetical protein
MRGLGEPGPLSATGLRAEPGRAADSGAEVGTGGASVRMDWRKPKGRTIRRYGRLVRVRQSFSPGAI